MLVDLMAIAEERYEPEIVELLRMCHERALHLQVPPRPGHEGLPGCWFGGRPTLPADIEWPVYVRNGHAIPMNFVAQFDCAQLPRLEEYPMPEHGTLMFFYEPLLMRERHYEEDEPLGGKVIYVEDAASIPYHDPPLRPNIDAKHLDFLSDGFEVNEEYGGVVDYKDAGHWNMFARGRPPLYEGPTAVESAIVGKMKYMPSKQERIKIEKYKEKFNISEREISKIYYKNETKRVF